MDLREIGWEGVDLTHVVEGRDLCEAPVNTVMNLRFSKRLGFFFFFD